MTKNVKESAMFAGSFFAISKWFESAWSVWSNKPLKIEFAKSLEAIRQVGDREDDVNPPFLVYHLSAIDLSTTRSPVNTRLLGLYAGTSQDRNFYMEKVVPVQLGLNLRFVTNDTTELLTFSSMLLNHYPKRTLFLKNASGVSFPVTMNFSPSLTVADTGTSTADKKHLFDTTLIVDTFSGKTEEVLSIKSVKLNSILDRTGAVQETKEVHYSDYFEEHPPWTNNQT